MSHDFKRILLGLAPREDDGRTSAAVRFGVDLARRFDAELTVHVFVPQMEWTPTSVWSDFPSEIIAGEKKRLTKLAEASITQVQRLAREAKVNCISDMAHLAFEGLTQRFNQLTRSHDVTVLDIAQGVLDDHRHIFEEALFNSGHPVIVVPKDGGNADARTIAIAWDGSARSARAVSDALPLLRGAQAVSIVTVTGEKDLSRMAPGADVATYLGRHGVTATLAVLPAAKGDAGEALRRHAADTGADMIVMGAFVHSRLRQAVMGGVTRSLLDDCAVPLFMAY